MEAKLPDVNAGIVTHRKAAMNGFDKNDYTKTAISFDSIMALLPEDYKPEVNTEGYQNAIKGKRIIICGNCTMPQLDERNNPTGKQIPSEFLREDVTLFEFALSDLDSMVLNKKQCLVWSCPKCDSTIPLVGSITRNEQYQQPFYTGIIPQMPRREGLHDRIGYTRRFREWYQIAFREIEYKIGLYRAEYQSQNPDEVLPQFDHED